MTNPTVHIIGAAGMVGATAAYDIAVHGVVQDIALIDIAEGMVRGQALDIAHATAHTDGVRVRVGDYAGIEEDDIVVITCGAAQRPGQTRLELFEDNRKIITHVVGQVMAQGKPVYILMVSNPVDALTQVALEISGLPKNRVFGSGTALDSARLRVLLAERLDVPQTAVHALVMGEHGDSSFPALSQATVNGVPLAKAPGYTPALAGSLAADVRRAAYDIIQAKRATYYGIGRAISAIVQAIVRDTGEVMPLCALAEGEYGIGGVVIGLPARVGRHGAEIVGDYPLSAAETRQLAASAEIIRGTLARR